MKLNPHVRYKNSWMDFCCDGMFSKERLKGKDKRKMQKWTRNLLKRDVFKLEVD